MGADLAGVAPAGILILAIRRSAKKQAARSTQKVETKDEKKKREREEQRQRRRRDMAKFLADPRLLK